MVESNNITELDSLIKTFDEELLGASISEAMGDFSRAVLYYMAAIEPAKEMLERLKDEGSKVRLAEMYTSIIIKEKVGIRADLLKNYRSNAIKLWEELFKEYRLSCYRRKLELLGAVATDYSDYSDDKNYINRSPNILSEIAIVSKSHDLLQNPKGEVMICIHSMPAGDENDALLFTDGKDKLLLFKGPYRAVIFEEIEASFKRDIPKLKEVYIYEDLNPNEQRGKYTAKVVPYNGTSKLIQSIIYNAHEKSR